MYSPLVKPQGFIGRIADWLLLPVMYLLQGTVWEKPQRTHVWNNTKFKQSALRSQLSDESLLVHPGEPGANAPFWFGIPRFHMPLFGGWRKFIVLETPSLGAWHVGWVTTHGFVGVSRVPINGPVRVLIGPGESIFFAIKEDGTVYRIRKVGEGLIGEAGEFSHVPLL